MSAVTHLAPCPQCGSYHFPATEAEMKEAERFLCLCLSCGYGTTLAAWPKSEPKEFDA